MVTKNRMDYPIAIDNQSAVWNAWGNRYWPSIYLIDKSGNVRYRWDGELNWGGANGDQIMQQKIAELIAEK